MFDYSANLETDSIVFTGRTTGTTISTAVELIASVAAGPQTALWGRALPSGGRTGAQMILNHGQSDGLPSLLSDEVPFSGGDDPEIAALHAALEISAVAAAATNGGHTYVVSPQRGTYLVLLLGNLQFAEPRINHQFLTRSPIVLEAGTIDDHRAATDALAVMAGWTIGWTIDRNRAELNDPATGGAATAAFDDNGRLIALQGSFGQTRL